MPRLLTGLAALLTVSALASGAASEPAPAPPSPSDWTVMVGVEGRVLPSYEGSGSSVLRPIPLFDIRRA
jgi:outer membrane scaffolding protein for murein synthesis (MipA/OmpV family)